MKTVLALSLVLLAPSLWARSGASTSQIPDENLAFINGFWFDGYSFQQKTGYSVAGNLSFRRPKHVDTTFDLKGGYVIPPFGEAHNHNVEPLNNMEVLIQRYLQHGIFYVKNPDNLPTGRDQILAKLNRPDSIDVSFANGGFTGPGGHPAEIVKRNIERRIWTEAEGDGAFYYAVSSQSDLEREWPQFLATKPDFVKTYLLFSEEYQGRKNDPKYFGWKGMDPLLLRDVVRRAHAAGLRVSTHVESTTDFHNALMAGVDEINHTPGFRVTGDVKAHPLADFQISQSDAKYAGKHGVYVVTTLAGATPRPAEHFGERDELNRRNLALLKKHHVKLALGSDSYRSDTLPEALYLAWLQVFDNAELLRIWCTGTARTIFPERKIGELKEGYEASFLVLNANPIRDFSAVQHISIAVKQGQVLRLAQASTN